MKHYTAIVVAALAAVLIIPSTLPADEQMRIEKKIVLPPDFQFFFGASPKRVRDAINEFMGEDDGLSKAERIKPDVSDRPRRFVKSVEIIPCESWKITSWWVEYRLVRDDKSHGTNICDFCRHKMEFGTYMQPFWSFNSDAVDWHKDVEEAPKDSCGTILKADPIRLAKVLSWTETEKYTDTTDNSIAALAPRFCLKVLDVVSLEDFFGKGHYEAEKVRKAKFDEWAKRVVEERKAKLGKRKRTGEVAIRVR